MTNTLFIGKVYHRFSELPSTNDWATELLAKSKPPEGMVVRADSQTAGRGQFGSRWEGSSGENLLFSVILHPNWLAVKDQFYLSMAIALALHDAVNLQQCCIKWPNDLYLGSKKTAGILIQNTISGATLQSSVVGIGLNVNQQMFDPTLPNPTSLAIYNNQIFDLDAVQDRIFDCLEHRYLQLKAGRFAEIKSSYETRLFRINELSTFEKLADHTLFEGVILGLCERGQLRVALSAGGEMLFDLKEIRLVTHPIDRGKS